MLERISNKILVKKTPKKPLVEKTSGIAPKNIGPSLNPKLDEKSIREIIENYRNHPITIKIKEIIRKKPTFDFPKATTEDIYI